MNNIKYLFLLFFCTHSLAMIIDNLDDIKADWTAISDQVMGGISEVNFNLIDDGNEKFYRLNGVVSTKNNGGFIQSRVNININSDNYEGLRIKVKGNNNEYYVHLRVPRMMPWNYYYAKFYASEEWSVVELPLKSFKFSRNQNISLKSSKINSIGLVAYGRNFYAELDIGNIELY